MIIDTIHNVKSDCYKTVVFVIIKSKLDKFNQKHKITNYYKKPLTWK